MSDPYRTTYTDTVYVSQDPYRSSYYPDIYNQPAAQQNQLQRARSRSSPREQYYPAPGGARSNLSNPHYHSRSRSRRGSRRDEDESDWSDDDGSSRSRRHRHGGGRKKKALGVVMGAGAGGLLGHEILGGGAVGTVSGMLVGAIGAQALERRHERHKDRRRASVGDRDRADHKEGLKHKIGNFLGVQGLGDEARKRSRSHTDASGRRRSRREASVGSETEDERGRWRRY